MADTAQLQGCPVCGSNDTEHTPGEGCSYIPDGAGGEFLVEWSMPIEAESLVDAAQQALGIHRDPESIATVFFVSRGNERYRVDLHADGTVNEVVPDGT